MKRVLRIVVWTFLLLLVVFLLPMVGSIFYRGLWSMAFGWFEFLKRVMPQVTVSWSGLGMVAACSVLIVAGLNHLCAWIYRHRTRDKPSDTVAWRWQWSLSLYALLWLLFLAAIGVTGFVHQTAWLLTSNEPWSVTREHRGIMRSNLRYVAREIQQIGEAANWDIPATRKALFESEMPFYPKGTVLHEELHVLFLPAPDHKMAAAVVFHREPSKREKSGLVIVERAKLAYEEGNFTDLPKVLARFGSQ